MYRRIALPAANALVVPSETLEQIALKQWGQPAARLRRIANGIRTELYAGAPDPKAIPGFIRKQGETVIGTIAGLRPVKDLPMLVRAVAGMNTRVRLVIAGEGPEREAIVQAAQGMGIEDKVLLPGFLPDPHRYVGLFDIFALTSKSEQAPISVIEAMAAGLPVVAPNVGDIKAMVDPLNEAYLSPNRFEVSFRDRLNALADNEPARAYIGKANRKRARALFDESEMVAAYAELYGEAMGRPGILG